MIGFQYKMKATQLRVAFLLGAGKLVYKERFDCGVETVESVAVLFDHANSFFE